MKNKLLSTGKFTIIFISYDGSKNFEKVLQSLTPYSRFLYIGGIVRYMKNRGEIPNDMAAHIYKQEDQKINSAFLMDNLINNSELSQEWWQELIDKCLVEISS